MSALAFFVIVLGLAVAAVAFELHQRQLRNRRWAEVSEAAEEVRADFEGERVELSCEAIGRGA